MFPSVPGGGSGILDARALLEARGRAAFSKRGLKASAAYLVLSLEHGSHRPAWASYAQLFHAAAQGTGIEVQNLRRAARAFNHPVGLPQHRLNVLTLDVFERAARVSVRSRRGSETLAASDFGFRISDFSQSFLTPAASCLRRRAKVRRQHERVAGREQDGGFDRSE